MRRDRRLHLVALTIVRVLVTGATGCLGRATVAAFREAGWHVRGTARHAGGAVSPGLELVALDLSSGFDPAPLLEETDVVVHLAAAAHRAFRTDAELVELERVNVDAARRLGEAAASLGIRRLLASTVAVYGEPDVHEALDETAPVRASTPYARSKLEAERAWLDRGGTAFRIALVIGPHDRGNVAVLLRQAASRRAFVIGEGTNRKSVVAAASVAARIVRWSVLSAPPAGVFNVVDASPTQRELLDAVCGAVGRPPARSLPPALLALPASVLDLAGRAIGRPPRWRERVRKLGLDTWFDGSRLDRALDQGPAVDLGGALAAEVDWLRTEGRL